MIKFFRKIRQRLLTENKVSKYLIYAIGEIVLVVIGILIAVSINSWNEDRLDKKEVATYLEQIRNELAFDIKTYKEDLDHITKSVEYLDKVDNGIYDEVDLSFLLTYLTKNLAPIENDKSYTKLVESGKIELSEDAQVNSQLQAYYLDACINYNQVTLFHQRFVSENIEGPLLHILSHKKGFFVDPQEVMEKMESGSLRSMINWQSSFLGYFRPAVENNITQAEALIDLLTKKQMRKR